MLGLVGAQAHDVDGLRQLAVKVTPGGAPVRVGDVAAVERATMPVYTMVTANGKSAVLLNITRQPSSNTVAVANAVAEQIALLQPKLPAGVTLRPYYDQSQLVRESIRSVRDAILIGLVLACIILYLFLRDWRSSLIAGLVIPVTVARTVLFLWVIGESFNLMTLGGLAAAIGLVIDDAIVVVENIIMHRDAGKDRIEAIRKALKEISRPANWLNDHASSGLPSADRGYWSDGELLPRFGDHHDGVVAHLIASGGNVDTRPGLRFA